MGNPAAQDRAVRFDSIGRPVIGMLYEPVGERARAGVVLCDAFGDERRSSCLTMVRLARAIARAGLAALRFDYWGCGDSPGEFLDCSPSTMREDVCSAAEFLRATCQLQEIFLLGLRLGATLAARAAGSIPGCAGLVLIQPVADGAAYVDAELRRGRVRQMMTAGQGSSRTPRRNGDVIDLEGLALRPSTLAELRTLRLDGTEGSFRAPVLLVQVSFSARLRPETARIRDAYVAAGAKAEAVALVLPPFWSRIDLTDTTPLEEAVCIWLARLAGTH